MPQIAVGGFFLKADDNKSNTSIQIQQRSSSYKPTFFLKPPSSLTDLIVKVDSHLDTLIPVMEEKNKIRKMADCKNPHYAGAAAEFPWLPGYIIKLDAEQRIKGGEYLKKCKEENNLDLIQIPEQYPYTIPESYHPHTELRKLCIGKKIEGIQGKDQTLNLHQTQQFIKLIIETGVADLKWRNLVHCKDGTIALIDTETFWGSYYGLHSLLDNIREKEIRLLVEIEINQLWKHTNRPK